MNPPKTTKIATRGIMALTPSAAPRLPPEVESVSHALKAASLAVEPKKVMIQSSAIEKDTPIAAADAVMGKSLPMISSRTKTKLKMDTPHRR